MTGKTNATSVCNAKLGAGVIDAPGTYNASDEGLDGYSTVTVEPTVKLNTPDFKVSNSTLKLDTANGKFTVSVIFYLDGKFVGKYGNICGVFETDLSRYIDDFKEHLLELWVENPQFIRSDPVSHTVTVNC